MGQKKGRACDKSCARWARGLVAAEYGPNHITKQIRMPFSTEQTSQLFEKLTPSGLQVTLHPSLPCLQWMNPVGKRTDLRPALLPPQGLGQQGGLVSSRLPASERRCLVSSVRE